MPARDRQGQLDWDKSSHSTSSGAADIEGQIRERGLGSQLEPHSAMAAIGLASHGSSALGAYILFTNNGGPVGAPKYRESKRAGQAVLRGCRQSGPAR